MTTMKLLLMFNLVGALAAAAMMADAPTQAEESPTSARHESLSQERRRAANFSSRGLADGDYGIGSKSNVQVADATADSDSASQEGSDDPAPKKQEKPEREYPIHDFSRVTGRDDDTCSACHLPHVQIGDEDLSNMGAGELFRIARKRPALATGRYTPGPTSMICLTCHNGSVAVSTVGTAHAMRGGVGGVRPPGFATRDHPIGVPYPDRQKGFRPKAGVEAAGNIKLPEGRVECISCHDQHEEEELPHLLVMSNKRSALCLSCHEK